MNAAVESTRAPLRWRIPAALATLAGIACVAVVVAFWGWRWFGPPPVQIPRSGPADPYAVLAGSTIFGTPGAGPAATRPVAEPLRGELRLLGVLAEADGRGHALFKFADGSARLVAAGATVDEGTTLVAVRPDGITIRQGAVERRIALRATSDGTGSPRATSASAAGRPECAPPAGYTGAVVRLNAELLQGLIAQPESWSALVAPRDGGLVVRADSGFAAMLGLKRDDRLEQANGIALRVPEDVVGAVLRPLAASQTVRVTGTRQGQRRELLLQNAGRCPG